MRTTLAKLIELLNEHSNEMGRLIDWGSPIPVFGNLRKSTLATLGLNPSDREFLDSTGRELSGADRRFHTLSSLGLRSWSDINTHHLELIEESCTDYFKRNPYDSWFKVLDAIINETGLSYYSDNNPACHLDLIPFATTCKWVTLTLREKRCLLASVGDALGQIVKNSSIRLLVLNGAAVVEGLQQLTQTSFDREIKEHWILSRTNGADVKGYAYVGLVKEIAGIHLGREIKVIGFNHNIQSSFGVTNAVKHSIRKWIGTEAKEVTR